MRKDFSLLRDILFLLVFVLSSEIALPQKLKNSPLSAQTYASGALQKLLQSAAYNANLPVPGMLPEPIFTAGKNNTVFWEIDYTPAADDSILLINVVKKDEVTGLTSNQVQNFNKNYFPFTSLIPFHRYSFRAQLVRQKKGQAIPEIGDLSPVPAFSTQDNKPPLLQNSAISNANWHGDWTNTNSLQIQYTIKDTSGIDSTYLFIRNSPASDWSLFRASRFDSIKIVNYHFLTGILADGYYEFSITGKDYSHAPNSHGAGLTTAANWIVAGNKGIPDTARLKLHVDVTPPDTVSLTIRQEKDVIQISWNQPNDAGIGLQGYKILREGQVLADFSGTQTSYLDTLSKTMASLPDPDAMLLYEIQPYDSLLNLQTKAVGKTFHFWARPKLLAEPNYTAGTSNWVYWRTVGETDHYVLEWASDINFIGDMHSATPTDTSYRVQNLADREKVFYRVKQVRSDGSETNWSDVVWSIQDSDPPVLNQFHISEVDSSTFHNGWYNRPTIHLKYGFTDSAGIDSVIIWKKNLLTNRWVRLFVKNAYDSTTVVRDTLIRNLPDGDYQLFASARDHAHAPESHGGRLSILGNLYVPALSDQPLGEIKIDTKPPLPVVLAAQQTHDKIRLKWTASVDSSNGIGLAGYRILRNGELIIIASAADTAFTDAFTPPLLNDQEFHYQIQPFDSLNNIQRSGGEAAIWYRANPVMYREPVMTAGTQNQVCWKPKDGTLKYVLEIATDSSFQNQLTPLSVQDTSATKTLLQDGRTYYYRVKQVRKDGSETGWSNTVYSTQDADPPAIKNVKIAEEDSAGWFHGWFNRPNIQIRFSASDPSGLDSLFLFSRVDATASWHDIKSVAGLDSVSSMAISFDSTLNDGWYDFYITGRDHAHAAISHAGRLLVLGNKYVPRKTDKPQAKIKIDTTPPKTTVTTGKQIEDVIQLSWAPSADTPLGIGLMGYRILRDGNLIIEVSALQTNYSDTLTNPPAVETDFSYQIQPFDSLSNVQQSGGTVVVTYKPHPVMFTEPEITAGLQNVVCWKNVDDLDHYLVQMSENPNFRGDIDSVSTADTCAIFTNLENDRTYYYRVREIRTDGSLTEWSNVVHSTQDNVPPQLSDLFISESDSSNWYHHWYSGSNIHINFSASDSAGVDSVFLWEKNSPEENWQDFDNQDFDSLETVRSLFNENLSDGKYYFYLSGVDNAHAPASRGTVLIVKGNKYIPKQSDNPELFIFIDTTPPDTLTITTAAQTRGNRIEFQWNNHVKDAGIGMEGVHVYKENALVATLPAAANSFRDTITASYSSVQSFHYQIVPFDSLKNENANAGKRTVLFYPAVNRIIIHEEPEFTSGSSNTIGWSPIYLKAAYTVQCSDDSTFAKVLQEKTTSDTSAVFESLQDNVLYFYRVKAVDQFDREVGWSRVTSSRQDMSDPIIRSFVLGNAKLVNGKNWIYGSSDINIQVKAADQKSGKVAGILIYENAILQDTLTFLPEHQIETSFSYRLKSAAHTAIEVCLKALDAAGNVSGSSCKTIYWERLNEKIVAFPNPFNPYSGKLAVIRVKDPEVKEVRIYDYFGNLVRTLHKEASKYDFLWDGRNGKGKVVANGGYLCVIQGSKAFYKIAVLK